MESEPALDGNLTLANGPATTLAALWQDHRLLLWFSRGLACPFCRRQVVQLRPAHDELQRRQVTMVQITTAPLDISRRMLQSFPVPWLYASDPNGALARAFELAPEGVLARARTSAVQQDRALTALLTHPTEPHPEVLEAVKEAGHLAAQEGGMVILDRGGNVRHRMSFGKLGLLPTAPALVATIDEVLFGRV
jgi:peroxiredoxin